MQFAHWVSPTECRQFSHSVHISQNMQLVHFEQRSQFTQWLQLLSELRAFAAASRDP